MMQGVDIKKFDTLDVKNIEEWINSRYAKYPSGSRLDFLEFPIGLVYPELDLEIYPNDVIRDVYSNADSGFRDRFDRVLRNGLEARLAKIRVQHSDTESADYVSFGFEFVGIKGLISFQDILLSALNPAYDFNYTSSLQTMQGNVYLQAVQTLSQIKSGLSVEFWDRLLKDDRLIIPVASAKDLSEEERIKRVLATFDRLEEPDKEYVQAFWSYCASYTNHQEGKPIGYAKLDKAKEKQLRKKIADEVKAEKQPRLLLLLEEALMTFLNL